MDLREKRIILYLILIAGVVSVPLMTDYLMTSSSLASELSHIEVISREIGKVFPVRVGSWGSMDYGYSAASFQSNMCYLLPALLRLAGMGLGNAYKWTLFLYHLGTAVTAYVCFTKCFEKRDAGLLASILYTWCPYRLSEIYLVGDLGEAAGWMFLPLILLGIKRIFTEDVEESAYKWLWVLPAWGFSLILLSSTVFLFGAVCMTVLFLFSMGRRSLRKQTLGVIGKTAAAVVLVNAWFLIPMLLRMRDASAVGILIPQDIRGRGMYFVQYLSAFPWAGDGVGMTENGICNAQVMSPGAAVILLVVLLLWMLFTGHCRQGGDFGFTCRMLSVSGILVFFSLNFFPWDLFQDRNMLFSILLALMGSPAKLGILACVGLIYAGCQAFLWMGESRTQKERHILLLIVIAISLGTVQFQLGNILSASSFVRGDEIQALGSLMLPVVEQESVVWRLSEGISAAALAGCIAMWIVRRRKRVKKV